MVSDIFGASGRDMLAVLVAGERNPKVLAQLARRSMRKKITVLEEAFTGYFTSHHAFLLGKMLARVDAISADIAALDARIEAEITPFAAAVSRLDEIPGINLAAACVIIAEIGLDMARFPTAGHLVSWAKYAPGVKESAGAGFYPARIDPERRRRNHVRQLEALGYTVILERAAQPGRYLAVGAPSSPDAWSPPARAFSRSAAS